VHLYGQATDICKSYDRLQALARHAMGRDPLDGALYIFINRRGSQIKCLYFDRNGFPDAGRCLLPRRRVQACGMIGVAASQSTELLPLRGRLRGVGRMDEETDGQDHQQSRQIRLSC
jgi:hypothetical protein